MPIEQVTAWVMLAALVVYVLLGGADFGAGVWDLLARGERKAEQRDLIAHAIGPIWEANHVWLILIIVLMFTCFPPAFAAITTALHVPITLVLLGIVFRGSSFVFRAYTPEGSVAMRRLWGRVFAVASIITPVLLGVTLGAAASGELRWDDREVYISGFLSPWLRPFPWAVGVFTLAIFSFLAAVYLCVEAPDGLKEEFRARALGAALAVGFTAALTWILAIRGAPTLSTELGRSWWTVPLQLATGAAAVGAIVLLWRRRYAAARAAAVAQVTLIVLGYGAALFPYLVVPQFTIHNTAAPAQTHRLVLIALGAGAIILLPSLYYLFRVFKGPSAFSVVDRGGERGQGTGNRG